ncbi:arsenate reductase family protein [Paenibacillus alvei]|uniref:Arsenate reductase family protein n=1 Tax=Paenibacillus alvei TaxID=44250 RepID=A0ABT4H259_PAEAL|nr:arsenate reductase family protein [Paenibacillus alvei]MCY9763050.1 arsenate reductase family protein [Paenibacillus alvei]MCY9766080.1 arsenate reductase family protein [Paenibacillus alvei]
MMNVTVYQYAKCSTCRKAVQWLKGKGYEVTLIPIVEEPPSSEELRKLVAKSGLELKKFFNTSGEVYKEMQLKDKLPAMSEQEQLDLLASNGKLIKRPIVTDGKRATVGFNEDMFAEAWGTASMH